MPQLIVNEGERFINYSALTMRLDDSDMNPKPDFYAWSPDPGRLAALDAAIPDPWAVPPDMARPGVCYGITGDINVVRFCGESAIMIETPPRESIFIVARDRNGFPMIHQDEDIDVLWPGFGWAMRIGCRMFVAGAWSPGVLYSNEFVIGSPRSKFHPDEDLPIRRRNHRYRGPRESWKQNVTTNEMGVSIARVMKSNVEKALGNVDEAAGAFSSFLSDAMMNIEHISHQRGIS